IIKHTDDTVDILTGAPETGIYKLLPDGSVEFARFDYHRRAVASENEAFFLRILNTGDYRYEGADLGILVTRGRAMGKGFRLTKRARQWINGIKSQFSAATVPSAKAVPISDPAFKIM
ncbi:MAG: biotin carboxylase, partial [Paracoccaceae bacterium]